MRKVHIMSGVPGSGKSTYIKEAVQPRDVVLHRDDFRAELRVRLHSTNYFPVPMEEEWELWTENINNHLFQYPDSPLYIDQTTNTLGALNKLVQAIYLTSNDEINVHVFHIPLEECFIRNAKREGIGNVPEKVIRDMYKKAQKDPIIQETLCRLSLPRDTKVNAKVVLHND